MKKITVTFLSFIFIIAVFTACGKPSNATADDNKSPAPAEITSSQIYDYFALHSESLRCLVSKGDFKRNTVDDETMVLFAISEITEQYRSKLDSGKIDEQNFEMMTMEFYASEINEITRKFFDKTPAHYNNRHTSYSMESGGVTVTDPDTEFDCRLVPKEFERTGNSYTGTFDYYEFPSDTKINEKKMSASSSAYDEYIISSITGKFIVVYDDENNANILFENFKVTAA